MSTKSKWLPLRCDASLQSPSTYGRNGYGVEPPPAPEGKTRCPVCWKPVKLMQRTGFGGRRIPSHNLDHDLIQQKEVAFEAARKAKVKGGAA